MFRIWPVGMFATTESEWEEAVNWVWPEVRQIEWEGRWADDGGYTAPDANARHGASGAD